MKHKALFAYLVLVALISCAFIVGMKALGQRGNFLAGPYMLTPALAAILTRIFWYDKHFADAWLRFGRLKNYVIFYAITIGVVVVSYLAMTGCLAITWDFTGQTFLTQLQEQMAGSGQDINDLPAGLTPPIMLLIFFVGGLTVFNLPTTIFGFGEEFGWRGLMFPLLYRIRPALAYAGGGLIWFAWHVPLVFVLPQTTAFTWWQMAANGLVLAVGACCTSIFFAYAYARSGTIWLPSFVHAVFNNASRSASYFTKIEDQLMANVGLTATMVLVVVILCLKGGFAEFAKLSEPQP